MAERSEREVLHHLIEVCEDGERGFLTAAERVSNPGLKSLFKELAAERARFASALVPHLQRLGGRTDLDGSTAATLHRGWMGLRSLVPGQDHAVVTEAQRGEQAALEAYQDALNGILPPTVISLVEQQRDAMQQASGRIREREVLHRLIAVCRDGNRGFLAAADHVNNPKLKSLFNELAEERARFAAALVSHLERLGGHADLEGSTAATLHRGWIGLKSLVPGHDHAVVTEAKRGEQVALDAYEDALKGVLPPTVTSLVEQQRDAMRKANDRIRSIDMGYS